MGQCDPPPNFTEEYPLMHFESCFAFYSNVLSSLGWCSAALAFCSRLVNPFAFVAIIIINFGLLANPAEGQRGYQFPY